MTTEAVMVKWLNGAGWRVCDNTLASVLADESKRAQRGLRPARNRMVSRPARVRSGKRDFLRECVASMATLSDDVSRYSI